MVWVTQDYTGMPRYKLRYRYGESGVTDGIYCSFEGGAWALIVAVIYLRGFCVVPESDNRLALYYIDETRTLREKISTNGGETWA